MIIDKADFSRIQSVKQARQIGDNICTDFINDGDLAATLHNSATESPPVADCVCKLAYGLIRVQVPVYYSLFPTPRHDRPLRDS